MTEQAQPVEGQDQQQVEGQPTTVQTAPEPQAPQPVQGNGGPWASDLEQRFADPAVRSQVDEFLRQTVQPHVTRLEQSVSQYEPARQLYDDLLSDQDNTYIAVTEELYGPEAAQIVREQLFAEQQEDEQEQSETEQTLDPRVEALLQEREQQQAAAAYEQELNRLRGQDPDLEPDEFHPFVIAADGDFDVAHAGYVQWRDGVKARYGAPTPEPEQPAAPAALGTVSDAGAAPPVQEKYESIDDALNATMDEIRSKRAPTAVGSV